MATLTAGQSASFFFDSFWTILVSASKASGTLAFTSSAENLRSSFNSGLQSRTYGPFGAPGTVTITVAEGSVDYTLTRIDEVSGRGTLTYAQLPDPTLFPEGTQTYTSDEGMVFQRGGGWVAVGGEAATWGGIDGDLPDQSDLWAALGGTTFGGASDETIDDYDDDTGVADTIVIDGLTWALVYYTDGRLNTATSGALVREYVYDGQNRYVGINGVKLQGGALMLTFAQMIALIPTVPGLRVRLTDTYPNTEFCWSGTMWLATNNRFRVAGNGLRRIVIGGTGATYSQTGTTVTVTLTGHGFTAADDNGASIYLTQSTGALLTGWFTNFTYVDANTFTVTSTVSQSTSGNLGTQTGEITVDTFTLKGKLLGPNGGLTGWFKTQVNANNANNKRLRVRLNGTAVFTPNSTTGAVSSQIPFHLQNASSTARQSGFPTDSTSQVGSGSGTLQNYTIDTEADVTVTVTLQVSTATDHMRLSGYVIEAHQG